MAAGRGGRRGARTARCGAAPGRFGPGWRRARCGRPATQAQGRVPPCAPHPPEDQPVVAAAKELPIATDHPRLRRRRGKVRGPHRMIDAISSTAAATSPSMRARVRAWSGSTMRTQTRHSRSASIVSTAPPATAGARRHPSSLRTQVQLPTSVAIVRAEPLRSAKVRGTACRKVSRIAHRATGSVPPGRPVASRPGADGQAR